MSNETKHTPGPWSVDIEEGEAGVFEDRNGAHLATIAVDVGHDEALANANLIAAAPDLLATLREAAEVLDRAVATGFAWAEQPANDAHAAIAKAEAFKRQRDEAGPRVPRRVLEGADRLQGVRAEGEDRQGLGARLVSYTTFYTITKAGNLRWAAEQRNSHLFAPRIWDRLFDKYLKDPNIPYDNWMSRSEELWKLSKDPRLTREERIALLVTFDRVWIPREMIRDVFIAVYRTNGYLPREFLDWEKPKRIRGVCIYGTSVGENLWEKRSKDGEYTGKLINIDRDECLLGGKPWNLAEELKNIEAQIDLTKKADK